VLSGFAQGDRYANISCLVRNSDSEHPMGVWCDTVDQYIYDHYIKKPTKIRIQRNARLAANTMGGFADVYHYLETSELIQNVMGASLMTGLQKAVAPYRGLYTLQIIRFWTEIIVALQYKAMKQGQSDMPYFSEVFMSFLTGNDYLKSKQKWD
jgi:hypothetical protein